MKKNELIVFNIQALPEVFKEQRKNLIRCFFIIAIIAVVVAFSIPRIYKSKVMLAPESSSLTGLSNFSSIADMVGLNLDFATNGDAIYPEIYPDLIRSNDFLVSLFDCEVESLDGTIKTTYYDYLQNRQKKPWWTFPFKLLNDIFSPKSSDNQTDSCATQPDPYHLTKEQDGVAQAISASIACAVDKKTNVITIEVTSQDPKISADMAEIVRKQLQVFITNYRTNKARSDMEYIKGLSEDALAEYEKSRKEYAAFCDSYRDISLPSYVVERDRLENEMEMKFSTYRLLSEQLQMTQAKVLEKTPAFTVVQMAHVPLKHSNTSKAVILFAFEILGMGCYLLFISYKYRKELFKFGWQE